MRFLLIEKRLTMKSRILLGKCIDDSEFNFVSMVDTKKFMKKFMKEMNPELKYFIDMDRTTRYSNCIFI